MWITITPEAKRARKLSGMKYHGGKTRQFWLDLVGIDPASVRGVRIETGKHGEERCYWTADAEALCQYDATRHNYTLLGVAN